MFFKDVCCADAPELAPSVYVHSDVSMGEDQNFEGDEPTLDEPSFTAVLQKDTEDEPLGIRVDSTDEKVLHICQVAADHDTPVVRYNAKAGPHQIQSGDYVLAVNGFSADSMPLGIRVSDTLREQLSMPQVELLVSRPKSFHVQVQCDGEG